MNQKKFNLKEWIKEKWNGMTEREKGVLIGSFFGSFIATVVGGTVANRKEKAMLEAATAVCNERSKAAYQKGLKDGELGGYYKLLTDPESAFKKMGCTDIHKF